VVFTGSNRRLHWRAALALRSTHDRRRYTQNVGMDHSITRSRLSDGTRDEGPSRQRTEIRKGSTGIPRTSRDSCGAFFLLSKSYLISSEFNHAPADSWLLPSRVSMSMKIASREFTMMYRVRSQYLVFVVRYVISMSVYVYGWP